ncbi:MAG: hypothetical protein JWM11_5644 [Planctomycetaceae bacterium]|nr:hypothetical protein [Planctomycetaceae bacterium]
MPLRSSKGRSVTCKSRALKKRDAERSIIIQTVCVPTVVNDNRASWRLIAPRLLERTLAFICFARRLTIGNGSQRILRVLPVQ